MPLRRANESTRQWVYRFHWLEFFSATGAIGWALLSIFNHVAMVDRPAYARLASTGITEGHWEITGLLLGALQALVLFRCRFVFRYWVAAAMVPWFLFLGLQIALVDVAPGVIFYFMASAMNVVTLARLGGRYG